MTQTERVVRMGQKALERLEVIRQLNTDHEWVNRDLYRLLYKEDIYITAYEKIKSKPGNMTPGTDGETADGTSLTTIRSIIADMRGEKYQFKPARRGYVPKSNGKKRPLGIPTFRDKLVQEAMRMILEAIYDSPKNPYFKDSSYGFRPGRGPHSALKEYRARWSGVNWIIEGDIKGYFDDIDHHILVGLLRKKIDDEKFLRLVWKLLRAGYLEFRERQDSLIGTPQGGIVSPILANVYLHELDVKMEQLQQEYESGEKRRGNPEYRSITYRIRKLYKEHGELTPEAKRLMQQRREIPSTDPEDPNFIRLKYIRYADDWIVGVIGPKALARRLKEEIGAFLRDDLKLQLSDEKTRITHARTEQAFFLGTLLSIGWGPDSEKKLTTSTNGSGRKFKRRSTGWTPVMRAPIPKIIKRLSEEGLCDSDGFPRGVPMWTSLDADQIVERSSAISRGILNYYRFADNFRQMTVVEHICQYSAAKTLARKYKTSMREIFKRYGKTLAVKSPSGRQVKFNLNRDWSRTPRAFQHQNGVIDRVAFQRRLRTRSKLG